jgi:methionyl-tRNA synthetase
MGNLYFTTAIDYPNALPHIGTAFEKIGADVQARYRRMKGDSVQLLLGNDENTVKVLKKAKSLNLDTQEYANEMAKDFRKVWSELDISNTCFIQTSDRKHKDVVENFIKMVHASGYIYKKNYCAPYCEGCEEFKTEANLTDGRCQNHPDQELPILEEENYFFALSRFKEKLLNIIENKEMLIKPEARYNEIVNIIKTELKDISISRRNIPWGVPVPWDKQHTVYVWFDALLSYLTGAGDYYKYWPADIHFIGKDITRFHCILWPAMLLACNLPLPKQIFAHGFIYERKDGELVKSSKSNIATNPASIVNIYGSDAYRYYFMSRCPYGNDGEYDDKHFLEVYNSDLANNFGNLVSRVVQLVLSGYDGVLPKTVAARANWTDKNWIKTWNDHMEECRYNEALAMTWDIFRKANVYMEEQRPWETIKTELLRTNWILRSVICALQFCAITLKPFMPRIAEKVYNTFSSNYQGEWALIAWDRRLEEFAENLYILNDNTTVKINKSFLVDGKYPPLFARVKTK